MRRLDRKLLRPCVLEPVEKEPTKQIPGVPEHFNYGVFFHDDHDYMAHLKSATDDKLAFRIVGIPEESELPVVNPVDSDQREPQVDDESIPCELDMCSDVEQSDNASELEDDFIQLAGGHSVDEDADEDNLGPCRRAHGPTGAGLKDLTKDKVLMMERFLYGNNEHDGMDSDEESNGEFQDPDETTVTNREFQKLLRRCKSRSMSAGQSVVTGTSIMSEGLQYCLDNDTRVLRHQKVKTDHLDDLDSHMKSITLANANQSDPASSSSESDEDEKSEQGGARVDLMHFQDDSSTSTAPKFHQLYIPTASKSRMGSKQVSMESLPCDSLAGNRTQPIDPALLVRHKGESVAEKKLRKTAVKQHRSERRQLRKINQENFRIELDRQPKTIGRTITIS